jgi:hypothetical protein
MSYAAHHLLDNVIDGRAKYALPFSRTDRRRRDLQLCWYTLQDFWGRVFEVKKPAIFIKCVVGRPDMCIGFRLFHNGGLNEKIVFSKKGKDAVTNRLFVFARMEVLTDGRPFPYKLAPKFKQTCAQIRARRTRDGANDVVSARAGIAAEIKTASFVSEYKKTHGWLYRAAR